jgi:DNA-binding LacI/PurR family transcriptional regulator
MYADLLRSIIERRLEPGGRLPTERDLASRYGVNRMAVHYMLDKLEKNKIISRQGRRGTFLENNMSLDTVIRFRNRLSRKVLILSSESKYSYLHWTNETITALEEKLLEDSDVSYGKMPNSSDELKSFMKELEKKEIKALIIFPGNLDDAIMLRDNLDALEQYSGDMFIFDRTLVFHSSAPCHIFSVDFEHEGRLAARHVREKGYEKAAFFYYGDIKKISSGWLEARISGAKKILGDQLPIFGVDSELDNFDDLFNFIRKNPVPAIIARTDENAADLIDRARAAGLEPIRDFAVISFGNAPDFRSYNLTTVAPPIDKIASMMADNIRTLINHHDADLIMRYLLRSHIIQRDNI